MAPGKLVWRISFAPKHVCIISNKDRSCEAYPRSLLGEGGVAGAISEIAPCSRRHTQGWLCVVTDRLVLLTYIPSPGRKLPHSKGTGLRGLAWKHSLMAFRADWRKGNGIAVKGHPPACELNADFKPTSVRCSGLSWVPLSGGSSRKRMARSWLCSHTCTQRSATPVLTSDGGTCKARVCCVHCTWSHPSSKFMMPTEAWAFIGQQSQKRKGKRKPKQTENHYHHNPIQTKPNQTIVFSSP